MDDGFPVDPITYEPLLDVVWKPGQDAAANRQCYNPTTLTHLFQGARYFDPNNPSYTFSNKERLDIATLALTQNPGNPVIAEQVETLRAQQGERERVADERWQERWQQRFRMEQAQNENRQRLEREHMAPPLQADEERRTLLEDIERGFVRLFEESDMPQPTANTAWRFPVHILRMIVECAEVAPLEKWVHQELHPDVFLDDGALPDYMEPNLSAREITKAVDFFRAALGIQDRNLPVSPESLRRALRMREFFLTKNCINAVFMMRDRPTAPLQPAPFWRRQPVPLPIPTPEEWAQTVLRRLLAG